MYIDLASYHTVVRYMYRTRSSRSKTSTAVTGSIYIQLLASMPYAVQHPIIKLPYYVPVHCSSLAYPYILEFCSLLTSTVRGPRVFELIPVTVLLSPPPSFFPRGARKTREQGNSAHRRCKTGYFCCGLSSPVLCALMPRNTAGLGRSTTLEYLLLPRQLITGSLLLLPRLASPVAQASIRPRVPIR